MRPGLDLRNLRVGEECSLVAHSEAFARFVGQITGCEESLKPPYALGSILALRSASSCDQSSFTTFGSQGYTSAAHSVIGLSTVSLKRPRSSLEATRCQIQYQSESPSASPPAQPR